MAAQHEEHAAAAGTDAPLANIVANSGGHVSAARGMGGGAVPGALEGGRSFTAALDEPSRPGTACVVEPVSAARGFPIRRWQACAWCIYVSVCGTINTDMSLHPHTIQPTHKDIAHVCARALYLTHTHTEG